jgi:hypothetical protein
LPLPHPLETFKLSQGAVEVAFKARFVAEQVMQEQATLVERAARQGLEGKVRARRPGRGEGNPGILFTYFRFRYLSVDKQDGVIE